MFLVVIIFFAIATIIIICSIATSASSHNNRHHDDWDDILLQSIIRQQEQVVQDLGTQLYMEQIAEASHRQMQEQFNQQMDATLHRDQEDLSGMVQEFLTQNAFSEHVDISDRFQHEQAQAQFDHFSDMNANWGFDMGSFGDFGF